MIFLILILMYLAAILFVSTKAKTNKRSGVLWAITSLVLTPIIAFILLKSSLAKDK